ncbi:hypothetical protein Javan253_0015 [Streptococcus phage Javan253]|uniref:hypothetical protein n=1 Tax=Streptococcus henryi TaxID=439219 RepID=UPI000371CF7B|nr:hypothetical protein [Streptococcus henryi]QBX16471.1 hypothetical protein Javan253_0015 [Streptococcus phage Javan253]
MSKEMQEHYFSIVAKANLLDVVIEKGFILPATLEKCIAELDDIDQMEIRKAYKNGND